jgi:putative peptidoglycan lipid II flippase
MAAFVLSNLIGLLRQSLVSRAFGTQSTIDAYFAASTYPELIFSLIAGGALASAFVPTLTSFLVRDDRKNAWLLTSAIGNLVILVMTAVSIVSALCAPWIVTHILAPSFDPQSQQLTINLLRILLISPVIFGVSGLFMGILNAHQIFIWPALAPSLYSLGIIFGV